MTRDPEWAAAYEQLDAAVATLHQLMESGEPEPPAVPTDYVLIVGSMFIDSEGGRCGVTRWFPKGRSQPTYITKGLLHEVLDALGYHNTDGDR
ncbi:DUF7213 family protein [Mycolicibacterium llatzerense]|uniref:DUF7213 family protein n=1 Tax=Mycolicibacterium llatzerense TaxID=280871 RepID=UPI0005C57A07|nr:hypothetical protein [Mycolicibacterium llatzerense]